jgi:MFS family permease
MSLAKDSTNEESLSDLKSTTRKDLSEFDVALQFLEKHDRLDYEAQAVVNQNGIDINNQSKLDPKILAKLDKYILTFMCAIYFLQFIDKTLLNYSAVMGIKNNLVGNEFANLGTVFNAAYIFGEPFVSYILQRFPLSRALSVFIILWGAVVACHSACHTYAALMVVRVLLGIFESSSAVSLISISGMYYTKAEQAQRIGYWAIQSGTGTTVGALLSFAFQHVHTPKFQSWQILFLVFGVITIVFGIFVWFYLPDNTNAWFLTDSEKAQVIEHVHSNQTGVENKKFKKHQIKELLFKDKVTWLMVILIITSQIVTGAVGTFSTTITATFGFTSKVSVLLQIPIGVLIIICIGTTTQLVSRFGHITLIHISLYIPSIVGAILLISLDMRNKVSNLISHIQRCHDYGFVRNCQYYRSSALQGKLLSSLHSC